MAILLPPAFFVAADVRQLRRRCAQFFGRVVLCDAAEPAAEREVGKIILAEANVRPCKISFIRCLDPVIICDRRAVHMERRVQIGCIAKAKNPLQYSAVCAVTVNGS